MSDNELIEVRKLEILSAVNKASYSSSKNNDDIISLNKAWQRVLEIEKRSNTYLDYVLIPPSDFHVLEKYGVKSSTNPEPGTRTWL